MAFIFLATNKASVDSIFIKFYVRLVMLERLFSKSMYGFLQTYEQKIYHYVDTLQESDLLTANMPELVNKIISRFNIIVPVINENKIEQSVEKNVDVDVRNDIRYGGTGSSTTKGMTIKYFIPFMGDAELFQCQPNSSYSHSCPYGNVSNDNVTLSYPSLLDNLANVEKDFQRHLKAIKDSLSWLKHDVDEFYRKINVVLQNKIAKKIKDAEQLIGFLKSSPYEVRNEENANMSDVENIDNKPNKNHYQKQPQTTINIEHVTIQGDNHGSIVGNVANTQLAIDSNISSVEKGSFDTLRHFFIQCHVDEDDIAHLQEEIKSDNILFSETKRLGDNVTSWIKNIAKKLIDIGGNVTVQTASIILTQAISKYLGIK